MASPDPAKTEERLAAVENAILSLLAIAKRVEDLHEKLPGMIEAGMEKGIKASAGDEAVMATVWSSAGAHLRDRAKLEAGGWVMGFLVRGASWLFAFLILASVMGWIPAFKVMSTAKP